MTSTIKPKLVQLSTPEKPPHKRTVAERLRHLSPGGMPFRAMPRASIKAEPSASPTDEQKALAERVAKRVMAVTLLTHGPASALD